MFFQGGTTSNFQISGAFNLSSPFDCLRCHIILFSFKFCLDDALSSCWKTAKAESLLDIMCTHVIVFPFDLDVDRSFKGMR